MKALVSGLRAGFLPAAPDGHRFEGTLGIYLKDGRIAFIRCWSTECMQLLRVAAAAAAAAAGAPNAAADEVERRGFLRHADAAASAGGTPSDAEGTGEPA